MRIAVVHFSRRKVAGAESYLEAVLPRLAARGHALGFWHETDAPAGCPPMALPEGVVSWSLPVLGAEQALAELQAWRPDVLYVHSLLDNALQARLLDLPIPAVFFSHNYYGTCISGRKSFALPTPKPCARRFGAACVALYYPRRCGGLSPRTMWRDYRHQRRRLALLGRYRQIVVASEHMAAEYARHGLAAAVAPLWAEPPPPMPDQPDAAPPDGRVGEEARLAFVGRMDSTKGGQLLIAALPAVSRALGKGVACHFVGTGMKQAAWERQAARTAARHPAARCRFHGWLDAAERQAVVRAAHLLVVPSVWPEPFGLVGLEAGAAGVPAAAFAAGGIGEWLQEGVNGTLAPGTPPRAAGLAEAIVRALADPAHYQRLRQGAFTAAHERFNAERHLARLESILLAATRPPAGAEPLSLSL